MTLCSSLWEYAAGWSSRHGAGIFSGTVGDDSRMLDVLYSSDSAALRGVGAWYGCGGLLACRAGAENDWKEDAARG